MTLTLKKENENVQEGWKTQGQYNKQNIPRDRKESSSIGHSFIRTRSVMFIEVTKDGKLAKRLREVEKRLQKILKYKTKIVEGVGNKLKDLLSCTDPWKGQECGRQNCVTCLQTGEKKQNCRKRNIIYESKCVECNPEVEKMKTAGEDLEDARDIKLL